MMGKERGHLTLVCDHPGQKGRSQKSWKGKKKIARISFLLCCNISAPKRGMLFVTPGVHILLRAWDVEAWQAGRVTLS